MKVLLLKPVIFIFCIFLFSFGTRNLSLEFKGDENFYFESAKEMLETGDLLTPRYMGKERFQKPAFFYWLILLSFRIFGVNWFAARLPSIIFGALGALLIFAISNLFFKDKRIGLLSALFSATTPLYYRYARLAVPDMALLFFMTLALYYFVRLYKNRGGRRNTALFFAAAAFAVLVKGLVGLIIPSLIVAVFCLIRREKKLLGPVDALLGIAVFALIVAPWFYLMYRMHGDIYLSHIWGREVLQRLGSGYTGSFIVLYFKGLFFYAGALITKFLPYSLFMPLALVSSIRVLSSPSLDRNEENEKSAHLFLILWIALVFFFFTFVAEKRTHYLLALVPPTSILVGTVFKKTRNFIPLSLVLSLAVIYIAITVSPPLGLFTNKMERAASVIKSEFKEGDRIGIGSHGIIPEELQVYFELPVENVKITYKRDGTPNLKSAPRLIQFLRSGERVFCVVKRKDYNAVVPEGVKEGLYVLDGYYVWKRRIRFDKELKASFSRAGFNLLREAFQNEIYVISNRR